MGTITANFIKPRALINLLLQISSERGTRDYPCRGRQQAAACASRARRGLPRPSAPGPRPPAPAGRGAAQPGARRPPARRCRARGAAAGRRPLAPQPPRSRPAPEPRRAPARLSSAQQGRPGGPQASAGPEATRGAPPAASVLCPSLAGRYRALRLGPSWADRGGLPPPRKRSA